MTRDEAKAIQDRIERRGFNLGHWFGVKCKKCCGVYPRLMISEANGGGCWYECDVCGTRTEETTMPWISMELWNDGKFVESQISMMWEV